MFNDLRLYRMLCDFGQLRGDIKMKVTLISPWEKPACLITGPFSYFGPEHDRLIDGLLAYCHDKNYSPIAACLSPDPAFLLRGAAHWAAFCDKMTILENLKRKGLEGIILVEMSKSDLQKKYETFIDLLQQLGTISELWIGAFQTLGLNSKGNQITIMTESQKRGITVRRLKPLPKHGKDKQMRNHLIKGDLLLAKRLTTLRPTWSKLSHDQHFVGWQEGQYRAKDLTSRHSKKDFLVTIERIGLGTYMKWPSSVIEKIEFISERIS